MGNDAEAHERARKALARLERNIANFFRWYRRRLGNVRALSTLEAPPLESGAPGSFLPDQHVLIGAGIDALATAWSELFRTDLVVADKKGPRPRAGDRWSAFLEENSNGSGIFGQVSAPMLADHLKGEAAKYKDRGKEKELEAVLRGFVKLGEYRETVRFSASDPKYADLVKTPEAVALEFEAGDLLRIISARKATPHERKAYENE